MSLTINLRHLEQKDLHVQGQLPAPDLQLDESDELIRARLPLRYDLTAHQTGRDVLVSGRLEMTLDCPSGPTRTVRRPMGPARCQRRRPGLS